MTLSALARQAYASRKVLRIPGSDGPIGYVRTKWAEEHPSVHEPMPPAAAITDRVWQQKGVGRFDGELLGVSGLDASSVSVNLSCVPIRYRDYLAIDQILAVPDISVPPLAVGVHTLLWHDDAIVCVRRRNGRLAIPGGAVDRGDLNEASDGAIARALHREVSEETGLSLDHVDLNVTGIHVGGYPTHIMIMTEGRLNKLESDSELITKYKPVDEDVNSIELLPASVVTSSMDEYPLIFQIALKSFLTYRNIETYDIIDT
ncbi:NUDIX domain-containing protein [Novosphingobium terrae]|uniref:NUDIX domain-containing protein n=1 Tax=Novosphingobium terrae TaxID=2726189 RepID=UPI001F12C8B2|nr:NUDIX hydrolase [Novosphingobium terrae]